MKAQLGLNSQPEGMLVAALSSSPAVLVWTAVLILLPVHIAFLFQQGSAFGSRKRSQAVSLLQPFWRGGTELHTPAVTGAQREEIRRFF